MGEVTKTLIQCDFDGTIAEEDVSFMLLETFADGDWKQLLIEYQEGRISVGRFNQNAFTMVKASRESLLEVVRDKVNVRQGFQEFVDYCHSKGFRFVVVSNGLDFYIEEILKGIGMAHLEVFAAQTRFQPEGLKVQYIGPDGSYLDEDFKVVYVNSFLREGYRIIYVGNGASDVSPAKQSHHIFATGVLVDYCKQINLDCTSFTDFNQVIRTLEFQQ